MNTTAPALSTYVAERIARLTHNGYERDEALSAYRSSLYRLVETSPNVAAKLLAALDFVEQA